MTRRIRGFRLTHKMGRVCKWVVPRRKPDPTLISSAMSRLRNWGRNLICFSKPKPGYARIGSDPVEARPKSVPKGHLAVYVGEKEGNSRRVLVPVIYFNHPLFGDLLKEAERVNGFNHSGGIQIPCCLSEFENVQTKIAAVDGGDKCRRRLSWRRR
ncbi:hypothetical protein LguiB_028732 [Lonicera macranthoides]